MYKYILFLQVLFFLGQINLSHAALELPEILKPLFEKISSVNETVRVFQTISELQFSILEDKINYTQELVKSEIKKLSTEIKEEIASLKKAITDVHPSKEIAQSTSQSSSAHRFGCGQILSNRNGSIVFSTTEDNVNLKIRCVWTVAVPGAERYSFVLDKASGLGSGDALLLTPIKAQFPNEERGAATKFTKVGDTLHPNAGSVVIVFARDGTSTTPVSFTLSYDIDLFDGDVASGVGKHVIISGSPKASYVHNQKDFNFMTSYATFVYAPDFTYAKSISTAVTFSQTGKTESDFVLSVYTLSDITGGNPEWVGRSLLKNNTMSKTFEQSNVVMLVLDAQFDFEMGFTVDFEAKNV